MTPRNPVLTASRAPLPQLAATFPAFRDIPDVEGEPVYLLKKAFWLVTNVALRFKDEPTTFRTPSTEGFPIFADNVLPSESARSAHHTTAADVVAPAAMLVRYGILSLAGSTDPHLQRLSLAHSDTLILPHNSATRLRAASVTACARIVERAHALSRSDKAWLADWTEPELDAWIWNEAKRDELREVARVAERGTVYY